jgi:hypothetical protein
MRLWGSQLKDADPRNNVLPDQTDYVSEVIEDANLSVEELWAWRREISGGIDQSFYEPYRPSSQHVEPGEFIYLLLTWSKHMQAYSIL